MTKKRLFCTLPVIIHRKILDNVILCAGAFVNQCAWGSLRLAPLI